MTQENDLDFSVTKSVIFKVSRATVLKIMSPYVAKCPKSAATKELNEHLCDSIANKIVC